MTNPEKTCTKLAARITSRAYRVKKAREIAGKLFALYEENDKTGEWELNKATDAIYSYIRELEES